MKRYWFVGFAALIFAAVALARSSGSSKMTRAASRNGNPLTQAALSSAAYGPEVVMLPIVPTAKGMK